MSDSQVPASTSLLDVQQVAATLNCSPRHVFRLADRGKMPAPIRLGWLVRWHRPVIERWLADGCKPVRNFGGRGAL